MKGKTGMTEHRDILARSGSEMVLRVAKKASLLLAAGAVAAALARHFLFSARAWWELPASVLFGGALGILNFRWLATAVERVYLKRGMTPAGANVAGAIINILKLSVIFIVLFIVIKWRLFDVFALLGGLSLCFVAIIWEGLTIMGSIREGSDR